MRERKRDVKPLRLITPALAGLSLFVPLVAHAHSATMLPSSQMQGAEEEMGRGQWGSAAAALRRVISMNYHDAHAHSELGYAYLHSGEAKRAGEEFKTALRLHPHLSSAENGLHLTFANESDHDAYLKLIQDQVKSEPNNPDAHTALAEELLERNQVDAAQAEVLTALRLSPGSGHAHCVQARIEAQKVQVAQAHADFEIAVKRDRNDDDAWGGLGDLAVKAKDSREAINCYRRAASASPEHGEWHKKLADTLEAAGEAGQAAQEYAVAASLARPLTQPAPPASPTPVVPPVPAVPGVPTKNGVQP